MLREPWPLILIIFSAFRLKLLRVWADMVTSKERSELLIQLACAFHSRRLVAAHRAELRQLSVS
jgi:hypothetical protein